MTKLILKPELHNGLCGRINEINIKSVVLSSLLKVNMELEYVFEIAIDTLFKLTH